MPNRAEALAQALELMIRTHDEPAESLLQEMKEQQWLAQARAALEAYRSQPDGWRPIETAPKDGTCVLLGEYVYNNTWAGFLPEPYDDDEDEWKTYFYQFVGGWVENDYDKPCWRAAEYHAFGHNPTHWMPLPAPPEPEK